MNTTIHRGMSKTGCDRSNQHNYASKPKRAPQFLGTLFDLNLYGLNCHHPKYLECEGCADGTDNCTVSVGLTWIRDPDNARSDRDAIVQLVLIEPFKVKRSPEATYISAT